MSNQKGISPVIATVLLVAAAILIGAVATVWVSSFASQQLSKTDTASCAVSTQYTLADVQVNSTGGVRAKVTNSGIDTIGNYTIELELSNGTILRFAAVSPGATSNLTQGQSDFVISGGPTGSVNVDNLVKSAKVLTNSCKQVAASTTAVTYKSPFS